MDDYGHHPEEVKAVLSAASVAQVGRDLLQCSLSASQVHSALVTCSTTLSRVFNDAARLVITDIYAAGEGAIEGVSAEALYRSIKEHGHKDVHYIASSSLKLPTIIDY